MLSGWAYFRDKVPFCKKNVAKEVGRRLFEVGVFSRDYGIYDIALTVNTVASPQIPFPSGG